jgi:hypothetical protein
MTRLLRMGIAALATAAVTAPLASSPASAVGNPAIVIKLPRSADLSTTGKAVRLRVKVTCSNMAPVPIDVRLTQTRSQVKVTGSGTSGTTYKCNGRTLSVPVIVSAQAGSRFNLGAATATANAVCDTGTCATDTRNVQLVRR